MLSALSRRSRVSIKFLKRHFDREQCLRNARASVYSRAFASTAIPDLADAAGAGSMVIPVCKTTQEFEQARKVWEQMKQQPSFAPGSGCYPVLLDAFCKFGSLEEALSFFSEMKEAGIMPATQTCNYLITSLAKSGMLDQALEFFHDIRGLGKLDASLYSTIVWVLCQGDRPNDAEACVKLMAEDGLGTDDICCNVVISAYERAGNYKDCIRLYGYMKNKGCTIGASTSSLMLNVYLKAGHFWDFDRLFKKMQRGNMFGYSDMIERMIDFYASTTRTRDAELLYHHMKRNSIVISIEGYNKLMELFINADHPSMVDRIYRELPRGVNPDEASERWLLRAFLEAGSHAKAFELYEQMQSQGAGLDDRRSCQLLLAALVEAKKFPEAMKLAVRMKESQMDVDDVYQSILVENKRSAR